MKAFKFMILDLARIKQQLYLLLAMGCLAFVIMERNENFITVILYLNCMATIMQASIFNFEQKADTGFVNMLPATDLDRIAGRFMTGIFLCIYGVAVEIIVAVIFSATGMNESVYIPELIMSCAGGSLIIMAIQNIIFLSMGKGNGKFWMQYVYILPGFLMWFGSLAVFSLLVDGTTRRIIKTVMWIKNNALMLGFVGLFAGILFTIAGVFIVGAISRKKDFV